MGENLWALREQKKISVAALANRAGLPVGLIMEYESGQRSIELRHLGRLARALYVEEAEIKLQSDPRPGAAPLQRRSEREAAPQPTGQPTAPPPRLRDRSPRPRFEPHPPLPPRPSQIVHLRNLLQRLGRTPADLEADTGKPIEQLDRPTFSQWLGKLQAQIKESAGATPYRRRAYLPESVDEFEARYLAAVQEAGELLRFSLFDGSQIEGAVIGFSPYNVTVRLADGAELTLNKLALVSYRRMPPPAGGEEPAR